MQPVRFGTTILSVDQRYAVPLQQAISQFPQIDGLQINTEEDGCMQRVTLSHPNTETEKRAVGMLFGDIVHTAISRLHHNPREYFPDLKLLPTQKEVRDAATGLINIIKVLDRLPGMHVLSDNPLLIGKQLGGGTESDTGCVVESLP